MPPPPLNFGTEVKKRVIFIFQYHSVISRAVASVGRQGNPLPAPLNFESGYGPGIVWYCMVWYEMVWYGIALHGFVL